MSKYTQDELDHAVRVAVIEAEHNGYMRGFAEGKKIYTSTLAGLNS